MGVGLPELGQGVYATPGLLALQRPDERYKVRFPSSEALTEALESDLGLPVAAVSQRRRFVSLGALTVDEGSLDERLRVLEDEYGATIAVDRQYAPEELRPMVGAESPILDPSDDGPTLDDVLAKTNTTEAWSQSRGEGITIAVVDSGVDGSRAEFTNRAEGWAPNGQDPWEDSHGHGTMVAAIAAASRASGGEFDGVAPDATVLPCRTSFVDGELTVIYEFLTDLMVDGSPPIVVNNSFGIRSGTPPVVAINDDFPDALDEAISAGVIVCFSAGNYHVDVGGDPSDCSPNSIWAWKGREEVLTTAAVDLDGDPWWYSSRGPGQHFGLPGQDEKPDFSAPVPEDGLVLWTGGPKRVRHWGCSGASPQVAGLAALLLAQRQRSVSELKAAIGASAASSGHGANCVGAGCIDSVKALQ
jgi:serine protease AprX